MQRMMTNIELQLNPVFRRIQQEEYQLAAMRVRSRWLKMADSKESNHAAR